MSIQSTLKSTYTLISALLWLLAAAPAGAQAAAGDTPADTTVHKIKKIDSSAHQLCLNVDIVNPITDLVVTGQYGYEFGMDYYLRNEFYGVLEAGWGGSTVTFSDLQYETKNQFIRIGFNKSLLARDRLTDWDMMFIGLRVGIADVKRGNATYSIVDSLWGNSSGATAAQNFAAVWAELTGGMRVELAKGLFVGWNLRGKFMMNGKSFSELSPLYIAGYGRGDKNTSFDFNVYISYGIRWKRQFWHPAAIAPAIPPVSK